MPTTTLVTSVHLSKAEALEILSDALSASWVSDDPGEVTLALQNGVMLSIEVPKFGEDLPLTLDCHHRDPKVLEQVVNQVVSTLTGTLGWTIHIPL
ncbi:hypothetical protein N8964_00975 [Pontimonas sp.]|nr:hypothetical protein [Pontimonas sp.]